MPLTLEDGAVWEGGDPGRVRTSSSAEVTEAFKCAPVQSSKVWSIRGCMRLGSGQRLQSRWGGFVRRLPGFLFIRCACILAGCRWLLTVGHGAGGTCCLGDSRLAPLGEQKTRPIGLASLLYTSLTKTITQQLPAVQRRHDEVAQGWRNASDIFVGAWLPSRFGQATTESGLRSIVSAVCLCLAHQS